MIRVEKSAQAVVRIIPHSSVLNSRAYRYMAILHELFTPRSSKYVMPWEHWAGLFVAVRPAPEFWWIVKMAASEEGRRIEFFLSMPAEYLAAFKVKFRNHEQWRKCTLEEVPAEEFDFPQEEDTDLYKLKYERHNMFSLSGDHSEQTTPIRELLGVSEELAPGESLGLFIRSTSTERGKWKELADYAWQEWQDGKMPHRPGFDPRRMMMNLVHMSKHGAFHFKNLARDLWAGIGSTFMNRDLGEIRTDDEAPVFIDADREALLVNGDLSGRTKTKRNRPVFSTSIRLAVTSPDQVKRDVLARSVGSAFDAVAGDNRLATIRVNVRAKIELADLRAWRIYDLEPNLISVDEMAKIQQLPTSDVQDQFQDAIKANRRVEIEIPKVFLDDAGILVGTATDRGTTYNVHVPTKNQDFLFTPRIVCGSPRMGKDQHVINMIVEAKKKHNIGAVIPDVIDERNGHRGMADALRDHLDPDDILDFDMGSIDHAAYIGLEGIFKNIPDIRVLADRIGEELVDFLLSDGEVDSMQQTADYLREAAKAVMGDPLGIKLMLMSQQFRREKIDELDDTFDMDIWKDYDQLSEGKQGQIYGPIMRRLGQIINSEYLKPIFCQRPNGKMNMYDWIDQGKVVIFRVRMPEGVPMSDRVKQILTYWIVLQTFLIKLAMGGKSKATGTFIVLNEPHQFLSDGLIRFLNRMLAEGPKFRLTPVIVFHHFRQFDSYPGFVDMLMASSANWTLFKNTNHNVYEKLMPYLSKTFTSPQHAFESTKAYQYIACWLNGGEYEAPFVCDALDLVSKRYETQDNSRLTAEHIKQYGRPMREVLAEIRQRNKLTFQKSSV